MKRSFSAHTTHFFLFPSRMTDGKCLALKFCSVQVPALSACLCYPVCIPLSIPGRVADGILDGSCLAEPGMCRGSKWIFILNTPSIGLLVGNILLTDARLWRQQWERLHRYLDFDLQKTLLISFRIFLVFLKRTCLMANRKNVIVMLWIFFWIYRVAVDIKFTTRQLCHVVNFVLTPPGLWNIYIGTAF